MRANVLAVLISGSVFLTAPLAHAIEVLSAPSLQAMCESFDADAADQERSNCATYVLGFVDGAVATDVRVMLNVEAGQKKPETLTQRAARTRLSMSDLRRAAGYAEFCLGDPVPLREVVSKVVADMSRLEALDESLAARDLVYQSLRKHYPCET